MLSRAQMTKSGVTRGGWSVKNLLAHLVEWQAMNLNWYAAGLRGEKPAMPAPGYTLGELPRLNQMIYRKHHRRSLMAVMDDYRSHHERIVKLIESLPDSDLITLGRFSWTGPSWTLSDYLRASTAAPLSLGAQTHSAVVAGSTESAVITSGKIQRPSPEMARPVVLQVM